MQFTTPTKPKNYVLGFLFSDNGEIVVVIRKNKPEWQKGLLNGVGGKIEEGETPHEAMFREFKEETGLDVPEWKFCGIMEGGDWVVHCYAAHGDVGKVESMTDEVVECHYVIDMPHETIDNIQWLIPM